jgi:hypothetical protein
LYGGACVELASVWWCTAWAGRRFARERVAWLWRELALVVSMLCGVRGARRGRALKVNFFFF